MRRPLSRRLLVLTLAITAGWCAVATMISKLATGTVAFYPVFAIAGFAGGLLGARMSRRRTVVEGAIAAVTCGVITAIVNLTVDELQLVAAPVARQLDWVVGVGALSMVMAIVGGRLGERLAARPPGHLAIATSFGAACLGLGFAALPVLYLVDELGGETAMVGVELPLLVGIPIVAALLIGVSVAGTLPRLALLTGPALVGGAVAAAAIVFRADAAAALGEAITIFLGLGAWLAGLGLIGRALAPPLRRRLGAIQAEPAIAPARALRP